VAILGWGNQRLLRYDALAEHADRTEMARIFRERRGGLYLLGLQLALLAYVPVLGFFAPVVFGLAFIYSCSAPAGRAAPRLGCSYYRIRTNHLAARNALS